MLRLLQRFALGSDGWGDDHLDVLELGDVVGAANAERGTPGAGEVLAAVVDTGGAEQDLFQRRLGADVHPGSARKVGVRGRQAPVEALGGRVCGARGGRPDHDRVGAGRDRFADTGYDAHAAVGDDSYGHAAPADVLVGGRRNVGGGGDLRHAHAEDASCGAGGARPHADEDAGDAGLHELQRGLVVDAVAHHDWDRAAAHELIKGELVIRPRRVARGESGALDDENVRARGLHQLRALSRAPRHRRNCARYAGGLDCLDALGDQVRLDRFAIHLFEDGIDGRFVRRRDPFDYRPRIRVASVDAIEIQNRDAAELAHRYGEFDVDDSVHGRAPNRNGQTETLAHHKPGDELLP